MKKLLDKRKIVQFNGDLVNSYSAGGNRNHAKFN